MIFNAKTFLIIKTSAKLKDRQLMVLFEKAECKVYNTEVLSKPHSFHTKSHAGGDELTGFTLMFTIINENFFI